MLTAIILAAGRARRMGAIKQLLPWQGERTVLETVVGNVLASPLVDDEVRVILGACSDQVRTVLQGTRDPRLKVLENPHHDRGMLSSIQRGIVDLPETSQAFMIFLGDQPLVETEIIEALIRYWQGKRPQFLLPVHQGRRGHPVLISSQYVPEIAAMGQEDGGLRKLIHRYPERVDEFAVDSHAIHIDLDYPEEYRKYRPQGGEE